MWEYWAGLGDLLSSLDWPDVCSSLDLMASHLVYTILVFCANFHSAGNVIQFSGDNSSGVHTISPVQHHTSQPVVNTRKTDVSTVSTVEMRGQASQSSGLSVMTVLDQLMWLMGLAHKSGLEFLPSIQASFTQIFKFSSQLDFISDGEIILLVRADPKSW